MVDLGRHNLLGVRIDAVDYEAAIEKIAAAARRGEPFAVSALAVHGVMTGVLSAPHRYRLNALDLVVPDGQPVRWGLRLLHGRRLDDRVYGPTLTLKLCERAAAEQLPIFLYGSTAETLAALENNLRSRYPRIQIAGARPSRFRRLTPAERDDVVSEIRASGAAMTFVGLGCPRQEVWAYEFRELLGMPVIAVGAAFAFHAGTLPQAPPWMQRHGLEWLFRFVQEPRRLWKRYALLNPLYLTLVACQFTGVYTLAPERCPAPGEPMLYG